MELEKIKKTVACPVELSLRILGGKWRGSILYQLRNTPLRFNELMHQVQNAVVDYEDSENFLTGKVLSKHLEALQAYQLIKKVLIIEDHKEIYKYALAKKGQSVIPILLHLFDWGEQNF